MQFTIFKNAYTDALGLTDLFWSFSLTPRVHIVILNARHTTQQCQLGSDYSYRDNLHRTKTASLARVYKELPAAMAVRTSIASYIVTCKHQAV